MLPTFHDQQMWRSKHNDDDICRHSIPREDIVVFDAGTLSPLIERVIGIYLDALRLFVLDNNRPRSNDSHTFGPVDLVLKNTIR